MSALVSQVVTPLCVPALHGLVNIATKGISHQQTAIAMIDARTHTGVTVLDASADMSVM